MSHIMDCILETQVSKMLYFYIKHYSKHSDDPHKILATFQVAVKSICEKMCSSYDHNSNNIKFKYEEGHCLTSNAYRKKVPAACTMPNI